MSRTIRIVSLCSAVLAAMAIPSPASAFCANPQPVMHILGNSFEGCPDSLPVQAYAYVLGQEAINTGTLDIACEDASALTQVGHVCQPEAGIPGDGRVTITYDWAGPPFPPNDDCPNPAGVPGVGRNVVQVAANNGASVLMTVGYSVAFAGYILEMAHPGGGFEPVSCSEQNGLTIASSTSDTVCLVQTAPHISSDCDAGAGGTSGGDSCQPETDPTPTVAPGNLYTINGPCSAPPSFLRAGWQPLATTAGPGGSKCGVVHRNDSECIFFGASSIIGGVETSALTGILREACFAGGPCNAPFDQVFITSAAILQGRLRVDFGTENEESIVSFDVYAGGIRLNPDPILAKRFGSNEYSFVVGRGAMKDERSIVVEALKSDASSVRTEPVTVK